MFNKLSEENKAVQVTRPEWCARRPRSLREVATGVVLLEVRALAEGRAAHQTGEWLGPCVHQYVASEVALLSKSHVAVLAVEGPLARVVAIVNLEGVFSRQHFHADVTLILLDRYELL